MSSIYEVPDQLGPVPRSRLRVVPDVEPLDFDAVVRRLTPRLRRYATRRLGDRHEAEELVQEALLRAYDHRDELATEDDVAAWSTCVTGRLVIDRLRVRGRSVNVAEVPEGSRVGRDTADVVVGREQARLALDALDAMPSRQAAVLWAREVEGLAYDEIGERFAMTEPAVRSVLSRGRRTLRREFASRGGTLPAAGLVALAPWLDGLSWLDRLRRVAVRSAAPAVLGVAGLGVLAGVLVGPWSTPAPASPTSRPAVAVVSSAPLTAAPARAGSAAAAPATTVAVAPVAAQAGAPAAPAAPPSALRRTGLNDACVTAGAAGAGGAGCAPPTSHRLSVGPELPSNPTGVRRVAVASDLVDCTLLPSTPLTHCTTTGGPGR